MQPSSLTLGIQYKGLWNNWSIPRRTHNQHTCLCARFEAKGNGYYVPKGDMQEDQNFVDFAHSFMQWLLGNDFVPNSQQHTPN
jgi:hypothetical protein